MILIEDKFKPRNIIEYPPQNNKIFEEFFYDEYNKYTPETSRLYLPIFWTNYYISKNYGNHNLIELQNFLDSLDRSKKYFTIIQYDDNILNELKDLDILIFAQGGYGKYKNLSYEIPLNCKCDFNNNEEKNIFASFVGRKTHKIRNEIFNMLHNLPDFFISESLSYDQFKKIMSKSIFSFCPRGYGLTSFRIYEALCAGSIPIYIYDEAFIPFKDKFSFEDIGILINDSKISEIKNILYSKSYNEISQLRENGKKILNQYFNYDGCYKNIINILHGEK